MMSLTVFLTDGAEGGDFSVMSLTVLLKAGQRKETSV